MTNNILFGEIKVGDTIEYCFKKIQVGRIQKGYPTGVITGYDQYGNWCKIPFRNC